MKRIGYIFLPVFLLVLGLVATLQPDSALSAQQAPADFQVVRAYFDDRQMVYDLAAWKEPWEVDYQKKFLVIDVNASEYKWLLDRGFQVEIDEELTILYGSPPQRLSGQVSGINGYPCYRTVEETFATATQIVTDYPQLATWIDIGDSWEKVTAGGNAGYDLQVLKLTNVALAGPKPVLFVMTGLHAREYAPAELATRFAEYLINQYGINADATWLLDHHEIHLLLQSNPDGRKKAETGLSWRKNTNENYCSPTSNARGADLNRNFEFQWGGSGSSGDQCNETYRGPTPASETEVQAVQTYVRSIFPDQRGPNLTDPAPDDATGVFLDIHSYGQLVLWPWGFDNTLAPNSTDLQTLGRKMAYFNGYTPEQAIGLYPTDGTTDDFNYGDLGVAAYTFEIGTTFFQSCGTFETAILPDNLQALLTAAKSARAPYQLPSGPDVLTPALSATTVASGTVVTLTATLDDTRFNNSNGTEPTQSISGAIYTLDTPYWITTTIPVTGTFTAVDGAFNSSTETAVAVIDTTGLTAGRHTIFIQAEDSTGNPGLVSALFLDLFDPAVAPLIAGVVRQAGSNEPLPATVAANVTIQTDANTSGVYQMQVISGTYGLTAVAAQHAPASVSNVIAANYQTLQQDFTLAPLCTLWSDDVENGVGNWTPNAPWTISSAQAHSPSQSWTDSPAGNYSNGVNVALTSEPFDFSGSTGLQLLFWQRCNTEAAYDFCVVEASADGGSSWPFELARFDGNNGWEAITLDASVLDGQANTRIRFRLESDFWITADGWYVDDIQLVGTGLACTPAPVAISATVNSGTMTLEWGHMAVNDSYDLYRNPMPYFTTVGATPISTLPAPTATYSTTYGLENTAVNSFYIVRSYLTSNGFGANSNEVGEIEFRLWGGG